MTTSTVPSGATCFNVSDLFSPQKQHNTTGFQNSSQPIHGDPLPNGVSWLIRNKDHYDPMANYSNVWFRQVNESGTRHEGEAASWVFYTYAFPDCQQQHRDGPGEHTDPEDSPWFETSCQTSDKGQCRLTPNPIMSFYINKASDYNAGHGGCERWAYMGAATSKTPGKIPFIAFLVVVTYLVTFN